MKALLDSHAWLWLALGIQLKTSTVEFCISLATANQLYLSPFSIWELSRKAEDGRLDLDRPTRVWMQETIQITQVQIAHFDFEVAADTALLPASFCKDPADRALASTCRVYGLTLLTRDHLLLKLADTCGYSKVEV